MVDNHNRLLRNKIIKTNEMSHSNLQTTQETEILKLFKNGQYVECLRIINQSETYTLEDKLVTESNEIVCRLMQDASNKKSLDQLLDLAGKICDQILPFAEQTYRNLGLYVGCNVLYAWVVNPTETDPERYAKRLLKLLETYPGCQDVPLLLNNSTTERIYKLLKHLAGTKTGKTMKTLIDYMMSLLELIYENADFETLSDQDDIIDEENSSFPLLFVGPPNIPLFISGNDTTRLSDFSKVLRSSKNLHFAENVAKPQDESLSSILFILQALGLLEVGKYEECIDKLSQIRLEKSSETLRFAVSLVNAAALSALGKSGIALRHLRLAMSSPCVGQREVCALVLTAMALQFEKEDCRNEELQSWELLSECILSQSSKNPQMREDLLLFLLFHVGIFQLDSNRLTYNYARRLLELREYEKSAVVYEQSLRCIISAEQKWTLFKIPSAPSPQIKLRETLLCHFMTKSYQRILDLCDEYYESSSDFLVLFLDGLARGRLRQWKEALKSFNRAVTTLNKERVTTELRDMLMCRFQLNRAQVLEQLNLREDCIHALRMALQSCPTDVAAVRYYQRFSKEQGIAKFAKLELKAKEEGGLHPRTEDISIQLALSRSAFVFQIV